MSSNINAGCIVTTDFVTAGSKVFSGYIDYIDRETAVRNDNITKYSLYTDYMDNPEKTTELFTAYSDRLSNDEKQLLKSLYEKAQDNGSPMWQTVISFDNQWLEKNGIYNSEDGFLDVKTLQEYTRSAMSKMLQQEGLETATWSAAIHYNTDNFHIHVATVEPIPTRPLITVKTVQFSSKWIRENNIIQNEKVKFGETVSAHRNNNYGYRSICNRLKNTLENEGYNTRYLGDYITINSNGTINLSYNGKNDSLPFHSTLIDDHTEYKGKFKQSSIDKCRSTMVNKIIDNKQTQNQINDMIRNQIAASIKNDFILENRDIIKQYFKVYDNLPPKKSDWEYNNNKYIAKLRPEIDKITQMYLEQHKADEFFQLKDIIDKNDALYREAYGTNSESDYSKNRYKDLFTRCGNAILSTMRNMAFSDLEEYRSKSYISAEVNEAAETGEKIDFDGIINHNSGSDDKENDSKYWTTAFKEAKCDLSRALKLEDEEEKSNILERVLSIFQNEVSNGNAVAAYELGRCYKLGTFGEIDYELSDKYYFLAFQGFLTELNGDEWLDNLRELDDLRKYKQFYSKDKYEKDLKKVTKKIEKDNWLHDYLNYRVGRMLINGEGVDKDIPEGIAFLEASTSKFAHYTLGNLYYYGNDDVEQDYKKAYDYFSKAGFPDEGEAMPFAVYNMAEMIEKGLIEEHRFNKDFLYKNALQQFIDIEKEENNDMIEYKIATMFLSGKGCEIDEVAAEKYLFQSAVYGNTYAQTKLANLYIKYSFEQPDLERKAIILLEAASDADNDLAQYQLGKILLNKDSKYFNPDKGLELLEKSAVQGNEYAEYTLGKTYCIGDIIEQNTTLGLKHLSSAANKGNQYAQYTLGTIYYDGDIIEKDIQTAIDYLKKSAEQGNQFAQYRLGTLYLKGDDVNQNIDLAIKYLKNAANQDNEFANYSLGRLYLEPGDFQDIDNAIKYMTKAAELGNSFAAFSLGNLYTQNELINSNEEKANKWYTEAYKGFIEITQNNDNELNDTVLYNLGNMNYRGLGTEVNIEKAIEYFTTSADLKNEFAKYQLGRIYLSENEYQDIEKAIQYFTEAAEQDNSFAAYTLGNIYSQDEYTESNEEAADKWYKKAYEGFLAIEQDEKIDTGDTILYNLGNMNYKGLGTEIDIDKAIEYYAASANLENQFAQYQLGKIRIDEASDYFNLAEGLELLEKSANQNNEYAQYTLGSIYFKGNIVEQDIYSALQYLSNAAEQGNQFAQYTLGIIYLNGISEDIEQDIPKAIEYFSSSAEQGNAFSQFQLGRLYLENEDIKDVDKALDYLNKAAEQDNPHLKYNLGRIYLDNEEIMDIDKAIEYLTDSAENGNPFAAYTLGNLYSKNDFISADKEIAGQWYKMAFKGFTAIEEEQNTKVSDSVLYNLGIMHYNGLGTEQNIEKGIDYLIKSAQSGHEYAQYKLGKIYLDGEDVRQNIEYASLWLQASAEQGNQFAQYQLGKIYYDEEYGIKDIYKSITYLEQAAEQNNQFAQYQLGIIYLKGEYVDQNFQLAYNYLLQSAEQNNQFAQYQLGMIFVKGELTKTDYEKAIDYFKQSAEQNNQFAQYQLGKLYYFGADGVEVNKELAIDYLNKSAAQGNVYAKALLEWKPIKRSFMYSRHEPSFNERMVTLSSDMKMLFDRLANEHDHMLNQMIFNRLEKEKDKSTSIEQ